MARGAIKGITVEIDGNTSKLQQALKGVNSTLSTTQSGLKDVNKLLKMDPGNAELLNQKQKLLAQSIEATTQKLRTLRTASEQAAASHKNYDAWNQAMKPLREEVTKTSEKLKKLQEDAALAKRELGEGKISQAQYDAIQKEIQETEEQLKALRAEERRVTEEFGNPISDAQYDALQREIIETEQSLQSLQTQAKETASKISEGATGAANKVKQTAADAGKAAGSEFSKLFEKAITVAALMRIGKKIGSTVVEAVKSYAAFEQVTGGIETLFRDSADIVKEYARNAYDTAGISANEYMEQATSFAARLVKSLGGDTQEAARLTDVAIRDMADNSAKLGTAMESIENAYQGFAKQNYTMLDNLKLGYGGTKTEMERLLQDAEKISGIHYEMGNFADMIEAIHVVQENLGITGTVAEEAATTIEGSANRMKAAWENLMVSSVESKSGLGAFLVDFSNTLADMLNAISSMQESGLADALYADAAGYGAAAEQWDKVLSEVEFFAGSSGGSFGDLADGAEDAAEAMDGAADSADGLAAGLDGMTEEEIAAAEAAEEAAKAAKELDKSYADIGSAVYDALESGDDLMAQYEDLERQLESLDETENQRLKSLIDQGMATLKLAATVEQLQELTPNYMAVANAAGYSTEVMAGYLIDNGITVEDWASRVSSATDNVVNNFGKLDTSLDMSLEQMKANFEENIKAYHNWNENIQTLMEAAIASGDQRQVAFVQQIQSMGIGAADQVQMMMSDVEGNLSSFGDLMGGAIAEGMVSVYNGIESEGATVSAKAKGVMESADEAAGTVDGTDTGTGYVQEEAAGMEAGSAELQAAAKAAGEAAKTAAGSVAGWYLVGRSYSKGIADGVTGGSYLIRQAAISAAQSALAAAKAALDINSPSKKARDIIGLGFDEGIAAGIDKGLPMVRKAADSAAAALLTPAPETKMDSWGASLLQSSGTAAAGNAEVLSLLRAWLPRLGNMQMVTETGALVGQLAAGMDGALGTRQSYAGRGLA